MNRLTIALWIVAAYHLLFGAAFFVFPTMALRAINLQAALYTFSFHVLMFRLVGLFSLTVGLGAVLVARNGARYSDLAAVLLLAKVGGALAFLYYVLRGELAGFMLAVTFVNDLIWIPVFAWFLQQTRPRGT